MSTQLVGRRGRPSKGDRHVVTARMDSAQAKKLFRVAESQGLSVSELIANHMTAYLASIDVDALERNQEALPLDKAS